MESLPEEIQTTICKEAVSMHAVQRRIRKCIGPFFAVWAKYAYYERRRPGITKTESAEHPSVIWM